jgi:DNA-binding FadR family transcriptional regulator
MIRVSLHTAVASRIGSLIVQGKLSPGSILPNEAALAAEFGVSRTALREAIKVLASKGLVEVRRKTGTRVNTHSHWNMLDPEVLTWMFSGDEIPSRLADLMEVRMLIEPAAARMAAGRATATDLDEIRKTLHGMEASTGDIPSSVESDLGFHMAVLEATHNAFMRPFGALIQAALRGSFRLTSSNADLYRLTLPLHRKVFEAIEARNSEKAEAAMKTLLTQTLHDIDQQTVLMREGRPKSSSPTKARDRIQKKSGRSKTLRSVSRRLRPVVGSA